MKRHKIVFKIFYHPVYQVFHTCYINIEINILDDNENKIFSFENCEDRAWLAGAHSFTDYLKSIKQRT